ncbi:MAG TPA: hypothetical protein PKU97_11440, partial [Kofleriaceae bacterium]|nr:hypothetical protein [Kofleriaceae bacterium]
MFDVPQLAFLRFDELEQARAEDADLELGAGGQRGGVHGRRERARNDRIPAIGGHVRVRRDADPLPLPIGPGDL